MTILKIHTARPVRVMPVPKRCEYGAFAVSTARRLNTFGRTP